MRACAWTVVDSVQARRPLRERGRRAGHAVRRARAMLAPMGSIGMGELLVIGLVGIFTLAIPVGVIVLVIFLVKRSNRPPNG